MEYRDGPQPVHGFPDRLLGAFRQHLASIVVFTPSLFWLVIFFLIPLIIVFSYSFAEPNIYGGVIFRFTLRNYAEILSPRYLKVVARSIWISAAVTGLCLLFGYPVAYFISTRAAKWKNILMVLVILPFWTSSLVRVVAWMTILRTEGVLNTFLISLGIISTPLRLFPSQGAVMIALVHVYLPFMILPLYASIEKFDFSLLEAALDLGADRIKAFLKVTLPNTMPGIVAGVMLVFIPTLGSFYIPELLGGSKVWMIGNLISHQFLQARNWALGSAASFVMLAFVLVFIWVYFRISGQGKLELM
jgi:spermidine/putrescine transport system permease protein